jgi:phosphatidylglycerophosphatase A
MTPDTDLPVPAASARKKPRISFLLATWFGVGYLPKAPGTWGSLAGLVLFVMIEAAVFPGGSSFVPRNQGHYPFLNALVPAFCCLLIAVTGVWASSRVADFSNRKDPQFVVIDEVSGQMLTLFLGVPDSGSSSSLHIFVPLEIFGVTVEWQVVLAAFLFFRFFDIWKPPPIRLLEKLPSGWGIMADDWLAGIYAALLLRLALHFNLL